jgi:myo-inositol-1(or 4)-monophosphatase
MLDSLTTIARTVGDQLQNAVRPAPARTLAEFMTTFDAIDGPAAAQLRDGLHALRPAARFADELGDEPLPGGEVWVVDALDGAVQYLQGLPQWCVSLTLVRDQDPVATVLYSPPFGEVYAAELGQGATLNGSPVRTGNKIELAAALVATSQPPFAAAQPAAIKECGRSLPAVLEAAGAVRNLGPTAWQVAEVAAGRLDAFWEYGNDAGNLLGGALLAREAGALVTDATGGTWTSSSNSFVVAGPTLHGQLIAALNR